MRLIGRTKLGRLRGRGEQTQKWLLSWAGEVMNAHWRTPADVSTQFPNALHRGSGHFEFPVSTCSWRIHLLIAFPQGVALITDLKAENKNL